MRTLNCEACGVGYPMNEMIDLRGRTLCKACGNQFAAEGGDCRGSKLHLDPTICLNCGADGGDTPHAQLCQKPACEKCIDFFRNRPFPGWVRAFFAAVVLFVLISLVWNWRFFQGYFEMKAAWAAMARQEAGQAAEKMSAAAKHVPEVKELATLSEFFQGLACLQDDRCQDAQTHLLRCGAMPPNFHVPHLLQIATVGVAFKNKDYDEFLRIAETVAKEQPNDANAVAQLASAYACQYAVHGDLGSRKAAEAKLQEAKEMNAADLQASNYEQRIQHRLETREIIDAKEFARRFPNGWKPSGKSKT